jgi:hypothetical protein
MGLRVSCCFGCSCFGSGSKGFDCVVGPALCRRIILSRGGISSRGGGDGLLPRLRPTFGGRRLPPLHVHRLEGDFIGVGFLGQRHLFGGLVGTQAAFGAVVGTINTAAVTAA